jgi:hypothetical protein
MLACLTMSTTLGLELIHSLLHEMNTFTSKERWTPASTIWNAISWGVPTSTVFSEPYMWPTHCDLLALRTQFNQLQVDLYHLSHFPQCLDKKHLPLLLYNYNNLLHWLHATPISRLCPLLRAVEDLLLLPQEARCHLNVDTNPAPYVVEWVISQHSASITTATTARLCPLDTLQSFAPETLMQALNAGICPQVPWKPLTVLDALVIWTRPLASDQLLYPMSPSPDLLAYSPDSLPYSLVITPSTLSNLLPLQPLPWDQPIVPSTLLRNPHILLTKAAILDASRHPSLPPIVTLNETLSNTLPILHHLLTNMQPNNPHCNLWWWQLQIWLWQCHTLQHWRSNWLNIFTLR